MKLITFESFSPSTILLYSRCAKDPYTNIASINLFLFGIVTDDDAPTKILPTD